MAPNQLDFTFSDLVMGYVQDYDPGAGRLALETTDGRPYEVAVGELTAAEVVRNLGEPYRDVSGDLPARLTPGRLLFAYGTFGPQQDGSTRVDAKRLVLLGDGPDEFRFEERGWWVEQIRALADYYLAAEFGEGPPDWREYRTALTADGTKAPDDTRRQECDTISRLVYGFASAFLLTGDDRYLAAAESGTAYLRDRFRVTDRDAGVSLYYHAIESDEAGERKLFASEFGDDYEAIALYEQIYALAGPVQTFRATGDARVSDDVRAAVESFDRYFLDPERGGYFSHVDPVTLDPRADRLGKDRARKNWNSVGDHAPAYLINMVVASGGEKRWTDQLTTTADTIVRHFGDYDRSPFVNERFHEDWSPDHAWGWQQDRAVVGHNLKIAWNLLRAHHAAGSERAAGSEDYVAFARRIAALMPPAGSDLQRGGWYDVVERSKRPGDRFHAFAWHDRKAWWQQEQAILAYLVLAGSLGDDEYRRRAREAAAFYNAWFLDHDSGGVYFNVLASGLPYLVGTERLKGSHSMAGYHSFELCYLAAAYTNLLLTRRPLDLYFRPVAADLPERTLRVAPDLLPPGSVRIRRAWLDGEATDAFDAEALTVTVPDGLERPKVRVELVPTAGVAGHDIAVGVAGDEATVTLSGALGDDAAVELERVLESLAGDRPTPLRRVVVDAGALDAVAAAPVRAIAFARRRLGTDCELVVRGASPEVRARLEGADLGSAVRVE